jgi:thiol-disulfide isomerase/thioredoxin
MASLLNSLFRLRWQRRCAGFALAACAWGLAGAMAVSPSAAAAPAGQVMPLPANSLPVLGNLPSLGGASTWLNSAPLSTTQLRGKVVLVDFWTYSCINCIRTLPHVCAWSEKYRDQGLVVIGVHTPEFGFEKDAANIGKAIARFQIDYPIAVDSDHRIWNAFHNNAWPVFYIADAQGRVRARIAGEGNYEKTEAAIQALLAEAGRHDATRAMVSPVGSAEQAAPDLAHLRSGETYVGYEQASNFASLGGLKHDAAFDYVLGEPPVNSWSLAGNWTVGAERATLNGIGGRIVYRFNARDVHLVLAPRADGKPVRFQVTIDGKPPGADHGADTDAQGNGTVTEARLYQLVRQAGKVMERRFEIRFLDAGAGAFAFTFG